MNHLFCASFTQYPNFPFLGQLFLSRPQNWPIWDMLLLLLLPCTGVPFFWGFYLLFLNIFMIFLLNFKLRLGFYVLFFLLPFNSILTCIFFLNYFFIILLFDSFVIFLFIFSFQKNFFFPSTLINFVRKKKDKFSSTNFYKISVFYSVSRYSLFFTDNWFTFYFVFF